MNKKTTLGDLAECIEQLDCWSQAQKVTMIYAFVSETCEQCEGKCGAFEAASAMMEKIVETTDIREAMRFAAAIKAVLLDMVKDVQVHVVDLNNTEEDQANLN